METSWYVVKVLPGKERTLNEEFNKQINLGKLNNIIRFVCPTEKEFVVVKKKKVLKEKVLYSGYLYFESPKSLSEDELKHISRPNIDVGNPYNFTADPISDIGGLGPAGKLMGLTAYGNVKPEWFKLFRQFYDNKNKEWLNTNKIFTKKYK